MKQKKSLQNLFAIRKTNLFLMLPIFILACAPSVKVSSDYDRSANFSSYKTFSLDHQTTIGIVNPLNADRVVNAIQSEMTSKGFVESNNNPDLTIHVVAVVKNKQTLSVTSHSNGYGGLYRPYGFWGLPGTGQATVRKDEYREGTLVIDVVDTKTEKMVWTGTANAEINKNPKHPDEVIRAVVAKVMVDFPSYTAGSQQNSENLVGRLNKE